MNNTKILKAVLAVKGEYTITVLGVSMMPVLKHGQTVKVVKQNSYVVGDILVYEYKNEGLLAHRALKIENGRYFCKGDNSFRLEDITAEQVIGKIELDEDENRTAEFIEASYAINRLFRKNGYDIEKTRSHPQYEVYKHTYIDRIQKNELVVNIRKLANGVSVEDAETIRALEKHKCFYLLSQIPSYRSKQIMQLAVSQAATKIRYNTCAEVFADLKNIPYAVIKGAVLSDQIYGNSAYRTSGDIDLLIAPDNVQEVKSILKKHGFIQGYVNGNDIVPYSRQELIYQKAFTHQMAAFVKPTGVMLFPFVNIDVNLDIFWGESERKADMQSFLQNREDYNVLGVEVQKLKPIYEFISLCMHHYKDCNSLYLLSERGVNLSLFCDIYYYITKVAPDPFQLKNACDSYGVTDYVAYCVFHTYRLFEDAELLKYHQILAPGGIGNHYFRFGLTEDEYKYPGFGISEYVLNDSFRERFLSCLNEKDIEKIEINKKFM